jgi:2-polyprenyl-6-methoxyphenol hydroxylase-like FAD-dependent oxidoreductase
LVIGFSHMIETEVLIVGGGPAGLAAAIAARQGGFHVVVAEKRQYPIDKPCGEGVMPEGVAALRHLGITALDRYGRRFYGIRFIENEKSIEARFPNDWGVGLRRPILQEVLADHLRVSGGTILCGTAVSFRRDKMWLGDEELRARWIVAADGRASPMRQFLNYPKPSYGNKRVGVRQHFRARPWTNLVEVYWRNGCQAYVTPVNDEELCIALVSSDTTLRMIQLPLLFPELVRQLGSAVAATTVAGMNVSRSRLATIAKERCALIGDASGSFDPIIGIGLSLAFQQAVALGEALARGRLDMYSFAHARITRIPRAMSNLILFLDGHESLRHLVFRALAAYPRLFDWLLELRVGNDFVGADDKSMVNDSVRAS